MKKLQPLVGADKLPSHDGGGLRIQLQNAIFNGQDYCRKGVEV